MKGAEQTMYPTMTTTVSLTVFIFALEMPLMELDLGAHVARPSVTPPEDLKLMNK